MNPYAAYEWSIKHGPDDRIREDTCQRPWTAFIYARDVDRGPQDNTREAACQVPLEAYLYSKYVDKCLHPAVLQVILPIELALLRERLEFD